MSDKSISIWARSIWLFSITSLSFLVTVYVYLGYDRGRFEISMIGEKAMEVLPWLLILILSLILFSASIFFALIKQLPKASWSAFFACIAGWIFFAPTTCAASMVAQFMILTPAGIGGFIIPIILLFLATKHTFSQPFREARQAAMPNE